MSEPPREGDLQRAIRAGNRREILRIMEWNRNHPPEIISEEEPEMPEEARSCMNAEDYISHEVWSSDYLPTVYIRYMDFDGNIGSPICYRKDDLLNFNEERAWVIPYRNAELYLDADGKVRSPFNIDFKGYGEPSTVEAFVRVPPAYYLEPYSLVDKLRSSSSLLAIPMYKTRLGNPEGSYGESRSHGQAPNSTVYWVVDYGNFQDIPETVYDVAYQHIYYMKTNIWLPDAPISDITLAMINQLQRDYPVAQKDLDTYNISLSKYQYYGMRYLKPILPYIEDITWENIISTMEDWMVNPPDEQLVINRFFHACSLQYADNKVLDYKKGDIFHTAIFIDYDPNNILAERYQRLYTIISVLNKFSKYPPSYFSNMPLYNDIMMFLEAYPDHRFGAMLSLLNYSFNMNLFLWIDTTRFQNAQNSSVIFGSIFEATRIDTNRYKLIKKMG